MLRYSISFPNIIKWAFISDLPIRLSLKNKRSIVTVGSSDIFDNFIDNLMNSKKIKWKTKGSVLNDDGIGNKKVNTMNSHQETTYNFSEASVDDYILKNFTPAKLTSILNICFDKRICPSPDTMVKLAHAFAKTGNKGCIELLISISNIGDHNDVRRQEYRIFQAEAIWRSGESAEKSLHILGEVYRDQPGLRRLVRSSLRPLLGEIVLCRGEASLMQAKMLALQLASPPYEDPIPLSLLWSRCILSEWFADQQMAVELLEVGKGSPLFKRAIGNRVNAVLGEALARHQIDTIYRLLEGLLKLSMTKHSQVTLGKLFDYKYLIGDLMGCEAVLKACDVLELDVGSTRRKQFEIMQAKRLNRKSILTGCKHQTRIEIDYKCKPVPKFKLIY